VSTSDTNNFDGSEQAPALEGGVLAALPRTRPQRTSPRRAAARGKATKSAKLDTPKEMLASAAEGRRSSPAKATKAPASRARVGQPKTGPTPTSSAKVRVSATSAKAKATSSSKAAQPAAPKQGYEPEEEVELGNTVNPPSGVELVESVADIVGELANSGLAAGGRILKDAFSLLRRP
jgi:hypothetical protein